MTKEKWVLVVGGSGGIGRAIVDHHLSLGHCVVATFYHANATELPVHARLEWRQFDVTVDDPVRLCAPDFRKYDVLYLASGLAHAGTLQSMRVRPNGLHRVNVMGPLRVVDEAPRSLSPLGGKIIVLSSAAAWWFLPHAKWYCHFKDELNERVVDRQELPAFSDHRIIIWCPGMIATEMWEHDGIAPFAQWVAATLGAAPAKAVRTLQVSVEHGDTFVLGTWDAAMTYYVAPFTWFLRTFLTSVQGEWYDEPLRSVVLDRCLRNVVRGLGWILGIPTSKA